MIPIAIFAVPWIVVRARLFQMRMTSYRNLRFNFHGHVRWRDERFRRLVLPGRLDARHHFSDVGPPPAWRTYSDNAAFGTTQFRFVTGNGRFFAFCYATCGLAILVYGAFFLLLCQAGLMSPAEPSGHGPPRDLAQLFGLAGLLQVAA